MPPLRCVDRGLILSRHAVMIVSPGFLHHGSWGREPDALASREWVVGLLYSVDERVVSGFSTKPAVSAIPGSLAETLVRLLRLPGNNGYTGGRE
jgi:hypothetical protein